MYQSIDDLQKRVNEIINAINSQKNDSDMVVLKINEIFDAISSHKKVIEALVKRLNEITESVVSQKNCLDITLPASKLRDEFIAKFLGSMSQSEQDLFVLHETDYKESGYFVEIGACNGIWHSNTHLLEKKFRWSGILVEPAKCWADDLKKNRNVNIDFRCAWNQSKQFVEFNEVNDPFLSTVSLFLNSDLHSTLRTDRKKYLIETVSLVDLLDQHHAPKDIDYLSIDTEGSELIILEAFDFSKYNIHIITCEHNWSKNREKLNELLTTNGYIQKYPQLTHYLMIVRDHIKNYWSHPLVMPSTV